MKSLESNCKRQAVPTLKGYFYQIWQSLLLWAELNDNGQIFLEGAEDIDVLNSDTAQTIQVKATSALLTLGLESTAKALNNFWENKLNNPGIQIQYRYLTTSERGKEQGDPFNGDKGLNIWDSCKRPGVDVSKLRQFLKKLNTLSSDLKNFIENSSDEELRKNLIIPVSWDTGKPTLEFIEELVKDKVIYYGDRIFDLPPYESEKVIPVLLKHVWEVVCKDNNRWLKRRDFLEIFQNSAVEIIPRHELRDLRRNSKQYNSNSSMLNPFSTESHLQFETGTFLETFSVPDMSHFAMRDEITNDLKEKLNNTGILVLNGSTGMGKSILSYQIVNDLEGNWYKLDLRGNEPEQIKSKLVRAISLIAQATERKDLVIDDLNFDSRVNIYENDLAKLIYLQKIRNGRILITSHQRLPVRIENLFNIKEKSFYSVPHLNESEIKDLLIKNNCPNGHKLKYWSKIISLLAGGHPLLCHAQVKRNAENSWQPLPEDEIFFNQPIDSVKQELKKIGEQFSEDARLLLYRLTILIGRFKRKQALDLGKLIPAINLPGEQFDKLVGPWIESVGNGYYRLSGLLSGVDKQNFTEDEIEELHKAVAQSFLTKSVGLVEFSGLLWHGLLGQEEDALIAAALLGLNKIDETNRRWIYQYIDWFVDYNIDNKRKLYPGNDFINYVLRQLQLEVAAEIKPDKAVPIADTIERELNNWDIASKISPVRQITDFLFLTKTLFHIDVPFPIKQAFDQTVRLIEILTKKDFFPSHPEYQQQMESMYGKLLDPKPFIYTLTARCKTADDVIKFLTVLKESNLPENHPMREVFKTDFYVGGILIDTIWLEDYERETPDWNLCLEKLDWVIQYSLDNKLDIFGVSAHIGKATIYQEHLRDTEQAFLTLDEGERIFANSTLFLRDYRAKAYCLQKQYDKALEIWREVLPAISEDINSTRANTFRDAEMCAVNLNRWDEAAEFALLGEKSYRLLESSNLTKDGFDDNQSTVKSLGYRADYAFAEWKKGNKRTSVMEFFNILKSFEFLPDPKDDIKVNLLYKRMGHTIGWMNSIVAPHKYSEAVNEKLFEPSPTCFSAQIVTDEIRNSINDLPVLPIVNLKYMLSLLEYRLEIGNEIFRNFGEERNNHTTSNSDIGYWDLIIKHSIRNLQVENLISQVIDYCSKVEHYAHSIGNKIGNIHREVVVRNFLFAALIIAVKEQKFDLLPLDKWRRDLDNYFPGNSYLLQIVGYIGDLTNSNNIDRINCLLSSELIEERAVAAILLLNVQVLDAPTRFYANTLILTSGVLRNIEEEVGHYIEKTITEGWANVVELQRFSLNSPQIYAKRILSACNDKTTTGIIKAARILFEARNSVSIKLDKRTIESLHNLSIGIT